MKEKKLTEEEVVKGLKDFAAIKEYMEFYKEKYQKYQDYMVSTLEKVAAREEGTREVAKKMAEQVLAITSNMNLIKKQFLPQVMSLCETLRKDNELMKKKIKSLDHQIEKIIKKKVFRS